MSDEEREPDVRFGILVRTRRTQLGITLDQLAQASGVSAAALSRVERGLLSPSLRNALAIARGLGCELAELVEREPVRVIRLGENLRFFDEATGIERLALARPTPDVELLRYTVPPKAASNRFTAHRAGTQEIFHMLMGRLTVHTAHERIALDIGDTAVVRVDTEHWFENDGTEMAQVILVVLEP